VETKQLVCNSCGCKFEMKDTKDFPSEKEKKETAAEAKNARATGCCPECKSYDVQTA
jgi:hypothetical protein